MSFRGQAVKRVGVSDMYLPQVQMAVKINQVVIFSFWPGCILGMGLIINYLQGSTPKTDLHSGVKDSFPKCSLD